MVTRLVLPVAALLALASCSSDPAVSAPPSTTPTSSTPTSSAAAVPSGASGDRSAVLLRIDDAAEAAGLPTPEGGMTVGALVLFACDQMDAVAEDQRPSVVLAVAATDERLLEMDPAKSEALKLGVPIGCPQHQLAVLSSGI